ncbi:hypothetical protein [Paraburkholderia rhizosphaerae]|uniref:PXPV repeat-containing protein n=1 Tax=Paraburkholderia rhizosphaerae TaxID=480658 RepID=A0A4R8LLW5_9BURK|nr:hypothetical protein [Paraburkholderia rhizosphaerae]TDY43939.1 hypothetical protein BX592_117141 [Paraburkholderia rhizosphaerae]
MRIKSLLGIAVASVVLVPSLQSIPAWADGPKQAYDNGGTDVSLDPGEERMTADEENQARQKDLSDAYHNGYNARAKEDAETYASLRDQLKQPAKQVKTHDVPPLPAGMPDDDEDEAMQTPVPQPAVTQRALPAQARPQGVAVARPRPAPPPVRYQAQPVYAQAPAYDNGPAAYYQQQPVYVQQAYAPPPPVRAVPYIPVYAQEMEYPVMQPVVAVASPYPVYRGGYWAGSYPRPYSNGPMIYQVWQ